MSEEINRQRRCCLGTAASRFTGKRTHRIIPGVGHHLPREAAEAFAAVAELAGI